eukprot:6883482-Prymnesium_polylepis.1
MSPNPPMKRDRPTSPSLTYKLACEAESDSESASKTEETVDAEGEVVQAKNVTDTILRLDSRYDRPPEDTVTHAFDQTADDDTDIEEDEVVSTPEEEVSMLRTYTSPVSG